MAEATRAATLDMMRGMTAMVEPVLQLVAAAWVLRERPGGGAAALNIAADTELMHGEAQWACASPKELHDVQGRIARGLSPKLMP
jgi:hypothetical protein